MGMYEPRFASTVMAAVLVSVLCTVSSPTQSEADEEDDLQRFLSVMEQSDSD